MKIGIAGGIASGKTLLENDFREQGVPVYDTDQAEFMIRTGDLSVDRDGEILATPDLESLCTSISSTVKAELGERFPDLYDQFGNFCRDRLIAHINDETNGARNFSDYRGSVNRGSVQLYKAWETSSGQPDTVFSSATLVERGNLSLVDELHIFNVPQEERLRRLLKRSADRGTPISRADAEKAIARQMPFDAQYELASKALGPDKVHVID